VHEALRGITHQCLFGLKAKKVTVSTVGASAQKIKALADDAPQVCLALSLHSAIQSSREVLIPSAVSSHIDDLGDALDYHTSKSGGRGAMLEYLLTTIATSIDSRQNKLELSPNSARTQPELSP
jgi:23S rRNA (adenine2503-C2)-methyltransferase